MASLDINSLSADQCKIVTTRQVLRVRLDAELKKIGTSLDGQTREYCLQRQYVLKDYITKIEKYDQEVLDFIPVSSDAELLEYEREVVEIQQISDNVQTTIGLLDNKIAEFDSVNLTNQASGNYSGRQHEYKGKIKLGEFNSWLY